MTVRTRIKICGITDAVDARAAVAAGVDALGFIFTDKSPRNIAPEEARRIIAALPPFVDAVGVFMDEKIEVVEEIVGYCGLTLAQLHGRETPQFCEKIAVRVLKSFWLGDNSPCREGDIYASYAGVVAGFLLDTFQAGKAGGTGKVFDWSLVERCQPPGPVVLAGGLNPENIAEAIETVGPFAVDVNSGVELAPGKKDPAAILRLVANVRAADLRRLSGRKQ